MTQKSNSLQAPKGEFVFLPSPPSPPHLSLSSTINFSSVSIHLRFTCLFQIMTQSLSFYTPAFLLHHLIDPSPAQWTRLDRARIVRTRIP